MTKPTHHQTTTATSGCAIARRLLLTAVLSSAALAACGDGDLATSDLMVEGAELAFPDRTGEIRTDVFHTAAGPQKLEYELIDGIAVFEGDIILSQEQYKGTTRSRGTYRWPGGVVPYTIDAGLSNQQRVTDAIQHWEDNTPFDFVARTTQSDYITFRSSTGCSSSVGRVGGQQFINLASGCSTGNTIHEIGHALGLWHEQSRTDRQNHIIINWANITAGKEHNFETYVERSTDGRNRTQYDFGSIMHYSSYAFSKNGLPTITKLDGSTFTVQRTALSNWDICAINRFYRFGHGSDFNGDGYADLATGVPYEDVSASDQGALSVIWGSASGLSTTDQFIHRGLASVAETADAYDRFGYSIATGDFNGDCIDDIAVGVPYDDVSGVTDSGSVHIFYGSVFGLSTSTDHVIHQNTPGIGSAVEASDLFGYVLASGDFNGDGFHDLAIGSPYEDNGSNTNSGWVDVVYGSASGLDPATGQYWYQGLGIQDSVEASDLFGYSLAAGDFDGDGFDELAIGVPYEDINGVSNAGAVTVLYGTVSGLNAGGNQFWHEANGAVPGTAEASDYFGWALTAGDFDSDGNNDLAISVPYQDVGGDANAGSVTVLYGTGTGLLATGAEVWNQDTSGVTGSSEPSDYFGRALESEDLDGDGYEDLVVGIPYEDVGSVSNAGGIAVIYGASGGLTTSGDQFWSQDSSGIAGSSESSDLFGYSLALSDFDGDGYVDIAVGVPYEDMGSLTNSGAVNILFSNSAGVSSTGNVLMSQDSSGIIDVDEAYDYFGRGL